MGTLRTYFPDRQAGDKDRLRKDSRQILNGILWIARSTKMHAAVDALGNPIHVQLSAGNVHDVAFSEELSSHIPIKGAAILVDRAYGAFRLREYTVTHDADCCIHQG